MALCNAAAISGTPVLNFQDFLLNLIGELGVLYDKNALKNLFAADPAFKEVYVPHCLFPGYILPPELVGFAGLVTRQKDDTSMGAVVKHLQGRINALGVEMKRIEHNANRGDR